MMMPHMPTTISLMLSSLQGLDQVTKYGEALEQKTERNGKTKGIVRDFEARRQLARLFHVQGVHEEIVSDEQEHDSAYGPGDGFDPFSVLEAQLLGYQIDNDLCPDPGGIGDGKTEHNGAAVLDNLHGPGDRMPQVPQDHVTKSQDDHERQYHTGDRVQDHVPLEHGCPQALHPVPPNFPFTNPRRTFLLVGLAYNRLNSNLR